MTLKQFIRFLKDNDAFIAYQKNIQHQKPYFIENHGFSKRFINLFEDKQRDIIDWSLIWDDTYEGFSFWSHLDTNLKYYDFTNK